MKKILLVSFIPSSLLLGFNVQGAEASVETKDLADDRLVEEGVSAQREVATYLTPSNLSGRSHTYYSLTVSTNVGGVASFTFNPRISGVNQRRENGFGSRTFLQSWMTKFFEKITTLEQFVSHQYSSGAWFCGQTIIKY